MLRLLEPLEAVAGEDLTIICMTSLDGLAAGIVLRENGVVVSDRIDEFIINGTNKNFVLTNTVPEDTGRIFSCSLGEIVSSSATVTIIRKIVMLYYRRCYYKY